ncbi:YdhK family protein [Aquibacillus salsiterrae]|uniref:YdhK family protein n=1 Tax=Aquibacillus salsiterrae TaxID=2950439 RepID=A0A9X3WFF5_9BACI|nr:YdhK family protein [Aquibacillus salsiterrae]MDC3417456.1 YdhK family protein [Aquibacillus salsiterrae]
MFKFETKKTVVVSIVTIFLLVLGACGNAAKENSENMDGTDDGNMDMSNSAANNDSSNNMDGMNHGGSGEVPEGLQKADNPTYQVGSKAIINAEHMEGMNGAEATISGAYDTTVYSVSYTPTNGGERVEDHKWVIHGEIEKASDEPFKVGDEVVLNADHIDGMDGATAIIDKAEQTTIYMVDYIDTVTGEEVTNHQWVTESELSPVEK